jgi:hypothetical protein
MQTDLHGVSSSDQHRLFQLFLRNSERLDPYAHFTGIMDIDLIVVRGRLAREFIVSHSFFSCSDTGPLHYLISVHPRQADVEQHEIKPESNHALERN